MGIVTQHDSPQMMRARTGGEAPQRVKEMLPDVILLDFRLQSLPDCDRWRDLLCFLTCSLRLEGEVR